MRSYKDAKAMAKSLRDVLAARNVPLSHSACLEIVAQQFGFADWNTLASKLNDTEPHPAAGTDPDSPLRPTGAARGMADRGVERVPVMPLRDVVVYPGIRIPLFAARPKTLRAAEMALSADRRVMLVTQRQPEVNEPGADHLYQIGTLANILETWELPGTAELSAVDRVPAPVPAPVLAPSLPGVTRKILVEGTARARIDRLHTEDPVFASVTVLDDAQARNAGDLEVLKRAIMTSFERHARLGGWPPKTWKTPPDPPAVADILGWFSGLDFGRFADTIAAHIPLLLAQKQQVLEILDVRERLEYVDAAFRALEQTVPAAPRTP